MFEPLVHIVYKTTHLPTGRYYIGVHSTRTLDDGYLGSGLALKAAIKKDGRSAFKRDILGQFPTRQAASDCERASVDQSVVNDPMSFNLVRGGEIRKPDLWSQGGAGAVARGWCMGLTYEIHRSGIHRKR